MTKLPMIKNFMLLAGLYFSMALSPALAATYKCTDGRNITYSTQPCAELNLESSGTVRDKVTVMPATPLQKKPEKQPEKSIQQMINDDALGETSGGTTIKPINPLIQKMLD